MFWKKKENKIEPITESTPLPSKRKEKPKGLCTWCGCRLEDIRSPTCSMCGGPNTSDDIPPKRQVVFQMPSIHGVNGQAVIPYSISPTEIVYGDPGLED